MFPGSACATLPGPRVELDGVTRGTDFRLETFISSDHEFVLALVGEFDLFTRPELESTLARLYARGARRVVVDLAATSFLDASTVGVLAGAHKCLRSTGGEVVLTGVDQRIRRLLEIILRDRALTIFETRRQALAESPASQFRARG